MSGSADQGYAEREQLLNAYTPQEISQLHMPVLDSDFEACGLPVPRSGTPRPWSTRGQFTMMVFFSFEEIEEWCRMNSSCIDGFNFGTPAINAN
jgi:hypothetical protein